jgi:hypothetical protein
MTCRFLYTFALSLVVGGLPAVAGAQSAAASEEPTVLGRSIGTEWLADLPLGSTIGSLLDTSVPRVISEHIDAGAMVPGRALRAGNGMTWTQTQYRVGDIDITDPVTGGMPLFLPSIVAWDRVDFTAGATSPDLAAPGLGVTLVPRRPSPVWQRRAEVLAAGPALLSRTAVTMPPAIARLHAWQTANLLVSGPLVPHRLGLTIGGTWIKGFSHERSDPTLLEGRAASLFAHLVVTPTPRDEVRLFQWSESTRSPLRTRTIIAQPTATEGAHAFHLQVAWDRRPRQASEAAWSWRTFAGLTTRGRTSNLKPTAEAIVDRLVDGPVPSIPSPLGTDRSWSMGGTLKRITASAPLLRGLQTGMLLTGASARTHAAFTGRIGELVAGIPARVWEYSAPEGASNWREVTLALFAGNRVPLSRRVTIDLGLRFEVMRASGVTNPTAVVWGDLFPQLGFNLAPMRWFPLATFVRFTQSGHRLPLGHLAYGDRLAPTANVLRWRAASAGDDPQMRDLGALVQRVGPGTGGDARFSAIDPQLRRPIAEEFVFGFESPPARARIHMAAFARRERRLIGLVDTGAPISSYEVSAIRDPGDDRFGGQFLPVYNRLPQAFGTDRYLLTNPSDHQATLVGAEITVAGRIGQLAFTIGGTASRSDGLPAYRGFSAIENDEALIGEIFTNPNAETNARGRLFTERGYTAMAAGVYQFPLGVKLGLIGRYMDGQHFARLIIVPDLNQGAEAIRAFSPGKTRFTYTLTVDGRLQKSIHVGGASATLLLDAFNLLNTGTEVEEFSVTGPTSRFTSAVQPPRSVHAGLRFEF